MDKAKDREKSLSKLLLHGVWGLGRRSSIKLKNYGIYTTQDFRIKDANWIRSNMGVTGLRTWTELHGEPCIDFE